MQAHAVLEALPHVQVIRQSRQCHEQSLEVLAVAFSLSYALRAQAQKSLVKVWQRACSHRYAYCSSTAPLAAAGTCTHFPDSKLSLSSRRLLSCSLQLR